MPWRSLPLVVDEIGGPVGSSGLSLVAAAGRHPRHPQDHPYRAEADRQQPRQAARPPRSVRVRRQLHRQVDLDHPDTKARWGFVVTSVPNGEVTGSADTHHLPAGRDRSAAARRPAARVACRDVVFPRRPHPGRDCIPAGCLPADSWAVGGRGEGQGLVRIEVVVPPNLHYDLHADEERELEQRLGLTEAVVTSHGVDAGAPPGPPHSPASAGPPPRCSLGDLTQ